MTISQGVKAGHKVFTHFDAPGARFTVDVADREKGFTGPWITVEDATTDAGIIAPQRVICTSLPNDDGYQPYTGGLAATPQDSTANKDNL